MQTYRLPSGFTVTAWEADSTWNGFPVPILATDEYRNLVRYLYAIEPEAGYYSAPYVNDGKVTPGWYCDGLQWEWVED